jgi:hypothetical protein
MTSFASEGGKAGWADSSETSAPAAAWSRSNAGERREGGGETVPDAVRAAPTTRPKLMLAKRTVTKTADTNTASSSIFGQAKTREQILAEKGIDAAAIDQKVEKKATTLKLTKDQEQEAEACRAELAFAEKELTDANENELPEGNLREKVEVKKNELATLLDGFSALNLEKKAVVEKEVKEAAKEGKQKFERPSERRKRQEQEAREREEGGGERRPREGSGSNQDRRDGGNSSYSDRSSRPSERKRYDNNDGGEERRGGNQSDPAFSNFGNRTRQNRDEEGGGGGGAFERRDRNEKDAF